MTYQAPMQTAAERSIDYPEWIITFVLLGIMVTAFGLTLNWPSHAAFFPRLLSGTSIVLIAVKLIAMTLQQFRGMPALATLPPQAVPVPPPSDRQDKTIELVVSDVDEDQGNEEELHDIFSRADRAMWGQTLAWLTVFFVGMYLFGLLVILPVFTVLYLRRVAKASWLVTSLYVLLTAGLIYALFVALLHLPLPMGVLQILGE